MSSAYTERDTVQTSVLYEDAQELQDRSIETRSDVEDVEKALQTYTRGRLHTGKHNTTKEPTCKQQLEQGLPANRIT